MEKPRCGVCSKCGEVIECPECRKVSESPRTAGCADFILPDGITYGGKGPGGEYYSKDVDALSSHSLWTEGEENWTANELEAIAKHKRLMDSISD